ncbi:type II toxin-antitoxin system prevent-host-death family antitoxin [Rhizobium sp. FKL33]|uniref:type II toxin-antitoxin system Phd/YefM family antitoxin n=1 Tax=Rhizobium sp. FKL33 TaxID=2562307 RepID=UPI0010C00C76|nr:type II toxin-antitoxin system prevent-host-death family antitoxin [Rhizobium sp. FKL33]
MRTVTIAEVQADLSDLIDEVRDGEIVTISRSGEPVAALVPLEALKGVAPNNSPRQNLIDFLATFPGAESELFERNPSRGRKSDL